MITTVDGQAHWDVVVTVGCNSYNFCRLSLTGETAGASQRDVWSFVFEPDGSAIRLEVWVDDGSEGPPWQSVPADVGGELEAIVAADPEAVTRLRPYSSGRRYAAWYLSGPGVMSLTYSGPLQGIVGGPVADVGRSIMTIWIDIEQRTVIQYVAGVRWV